MSQESLLQCESGVTSVILGRNYSINATKSSSCNNYYMSSLPSLTDDFLLRYLVSSYLVGKLILLKPQTSVSRHSTMLHSLIVKSAENTWKSELSWTDTHVLCGLRSGRELNCEKCKKQLAVKARLNGHMKKQHGCILVRSEIREGGVDSGRRNKGASSGRETDNLRMTADDCQLPHIMFGHLPHIMFRKQAMLVSEAPPDSDYLSLLRYLSFFSFR